MDTLQSQINTLDSKVDSVHQVVEQLSLSLAQVLAEMKVAPGSSVNRASFGGGSGRYASVGYRQVDTLEHKDVLLDDGQADPATHGGDKSLSLEVQVQRLTAQLTAAYNRIAALEEQLLSQRIQ
ncbi:hypothetical protein [Myxacorys almedinensis]|uniref:Uncharacterized protein n=1 Tax=Myxacorys almedinensis A TaxID=2690445 RepID=A0A8J8CKH9_9CYAN|nr:hypothetical protein [Myxacorys almedinensis]NDJ18636.1 hypothetical protein [Myxacorys almedinensis A]